jgi:hypothetical protein
MCTRVGGGSGTAAAILWGMPLLRELVGKADPLSNTEQPQLKMLEARDRYVRSEGIRRLNEGHGVKRELSDLLPVFNHCSPNPTLRPQFTMEKSPPPVREHRSASGGAPPSGGRSRSGDGHLRDSRRMSSSRQSLRPPIVILVTDSVAHSDRKDGEVPIALRELHGKSLIDHWWCCLEAVGLNLQTHLFIATNAVSYKHFEFWAESKGVPTSHILNSGRSVGDDVRLVQNLRLTPCTSLKAHFGAQGRLAHGFTGSACRCEARCA